MTDDDCGSGFNQPVYLIQGQHILIIHFRSHKLAVGGAFRLALFLQLFHLFYHVGMILPFCFYENPVTDIYFGLKPGYEELAPEMVAYADEQMPIKAGEQQLILFGGQTALISAAEKLGYRQVYERFDMQLDFEEGLDYPLPEGFHFVKPEEYDMDKIGKCCWKGFDHEETEGPWNHQHEQANYLIQKAPHSTAELGVIIADGQGEYACYAGMWWTPQNKLAYMEPLCTIPKYF